MVVASRAYMAGHIMRSASLLFTPDLRALCHPPLDTINLLAPVASAAHQPDHPSPKGKPPLPYITSAASSSLH
ncbi:hypothetical protein HPP92_010083 [Vanilla planifolia]|uniref:Uncharacterized protein n=1 Tax=Vanilla planifolia TaxID=51239 RepID=A0A835R079_VANPL|nr:hypothetical protein HPP92_010278 [Vanilla planifolia]KAG0481999.1 hypothetical protein HPP92_010083 [Vanilla planifolia]